MLLIYSKYKDLGFELLKYYWGKIKKSVHRRTDFYIF